MPGQKLEELTSTAIINLIHIGHSISATALLSYWDCMSECFPSAQGLNRLLALFGQKSDITKWAPNWPSLVQKRNITNGGPQLTSFQSENMMSPSGGHNWLPFGPKRWRHQRGAPTDLLDVFVQKRNITNGGPQLSRFSWCVLSIIFLTGICCGTQQAVVTGVYNVCSSLQG